jgi:fatty-acyl-CoA synthase
MLDGASLYQLIEDEAVTCCAGVPTVWLGLVQHMEAAGLTLSTLRRTVIGGAAMSESLIHTLSERFGVDVRHAWGMTETSPLGTQGCLLPKHIGLSADDQCAQRAKQGRAVFGVELRVVDAQGNEQPRDGQSAGELMVRGPWVTAGYFNGMKPVLRDGWFPTGDIATIDADGYMQITDRLKDVIKSGGEWISSIDLENAMAGHPAVMMAAVIGARHPKWDERPVMFLVTRAGQTLDKAAAMAYLRGKVAKWWLPDEVVFVDALPLGGTGKVQKAELRREYADILCSTV